MSPSPSHEIDESASCLPVPGSDICWEDYLNQYSDTDGDADPKPAATTDGEATIETASNADDEAAIETAPHADSEAAIETASNADSEATVAANETSVSDVTSTPQLANLGNPGHPHNNGNETHGTLSDLEEARNGPAQKADSEINIGAESPSAVQAREQLHRAVLQAAGQGGLSHTAQGGENDGRSPSPQSSTMTLVGDEIALDVEVSGVQGQNFNGGLEYQGLHIHCSHTTPLNPHSPNTFGYWKCEVLQTARVHLNDLLVNHVIPPDLANLRKIYVDYCAINNTDPLPLDAEWVCHSFVIEVQPSQDSLQSWEAVLCHGIFFRRTDPNGNPSATTESNNRVCAVTNLHRFSWLLASGPTPVEAVMWLWRRIANEVTWAIGTGTGGVATL